MAPTFTLTAIPYVLAEGEHKGHMEFVTFIAVDRGYSKKWSATNTGTLADDFTRIVSAANATNILQRLRSGETVIFPGLFELDQVLHQFGASD